MPIKTTINEAGKNCIFFSLVFSQVTNMKSEKMLTINAPQEKKLKIFYNSEKVFSPSA